MQTSIPLPQMNGLPYSALCYKRPYFLPCDVIEMFERYGWSGHKCGGSLEFIKDNRKFFLEIWDEIVLILDNNTVFHYSRFVDLAMLTLNILEHLENEIKK